MQPVGHSSPAGTRPNSIRPKHATPSLDPIAIDKYVAELVRPPAIDWKTEIADRDGTLVDFYEIGVRQFTQQILPGSLPPTTVWGYGPAHNSEGDFSKYNYPSYTIEATVAKPVRVRWVNQLYKTVGGNKNFLPHLLTVDPTLHWANPAGPVDMVPEFSSAPEPYLGPVPMVPHVHGAHVGPEGDGYAEAWYLPDADNIPASYFQHGSWYERNNAKFISQHGNAANAAWTKDSAVFQYPNDQRPGTLWYHDHTLGMTRLNVYAGPSGFYLLRGGQDGAPVTGTLPAGVYEFPVAIQDRSFNQDGSLFFPDSRQFFDPIFTGPYIPESDVHPMWNPEFFGNTIVVNGNTWPKCAVERRRYRIRFLNGCNARTLILKIASSETTRPAASSLPFWGIGTEGGFLPDQAVSVDQLTIMPGERYDMIIDFSNAPGNTLYLINEGLDEPFGGGLPGPATFNPTEPGTTGVVMRFDIAANPPQGGAPSTVPAALVLPAFATLPAPNHTRKVSLNELDSAVLHDFGPLVALLGTVGGTSSNPVGMGMKWKDKITESITIGDQEIWEIHNFTVDAHPIHIHQVMFRVINREVMGVAGMTLPDDIEMGYKDTFVSLPGTITRIQAHFDILGWYAWHCHIIDHEDNEMMRPYEVVHRWYFPVIGKHTKTPLAGKDTD